MKSATRVLIVGAQVPLKSIKTAVGIAAGRAMEMGLTHLSTLTGVINATQTI